MGLLGFPAGLPGLDARKHAAAEAMQETSGDLGARYGEHWWEHRNDAVRTYTQIMGPERAFGSGVIVDTMEVAGLWSAVPRLYAGIREALAAHAQAVGCHLSHLYPSGSSLYFTFLISGADDQDAEARYKAAWDQAARSCAEAGGANGMIQDGRPVVADAVLGVVAAVSFPPVMVNRPGGSSKTACFRDRSLVLASLSSWLSSGRRPAHDATTSRRVTDGKSRATADRI